jgi:hypothetical protein
MGYTLETTTDLCETVAAADDERCECYKYGKAPRFDAGIQCEVYLDRDRPQ